MAQDFPPLSSSQRLRAWGQIARQVVDLRLAFVIGLLAFMIAVSVDSGGNAAEAADLVNSAYRPAATVITASVTNPSPSTLPAADANGATPATARRLHHGMMTSAIMTSSRMTEAHFFTELPAED
ncbi:MAG: hypothetical protein ACHWZW_16645 [Spirulina sp.]